MSRLAQHTSRAHQVPRQAHLAARPAARRARAVRRRARRDARGRGASGLRADRHHQRDRALPPPDPLHAHSGLPARPSAPGAERRQDGVRILDARAVLRADQGHALLRPRHEAVLAAPQHVVLGGEEGGPAQGARAASASTAPSPSATSTTTCWWRRPIPGRAASRRSGRCSSPSTGARDRQRAHRHAQDLRADRPALRLGPAAEAGLGAGDRSTTCSTVRCDRRAS